MAVFSLTDPAFNIKGFDQNTCELFERLEDSVKLLEVILRSLCPLPKRLSRQPYPVHIGVAVSKTHREFRRLRLRKFFGYELPLRIEEVLRVDW